MGADPLLFPRSVKRAGWLFVVGDVVFVVSMLVVQVGFPGYSWAHNYISDLGNTKLSPLWPLFSVANLLLGACVVGGSVEMRTSLRPGPARTVGLALLIIAGIGAIGVGLNPEDVRQRLHVPSAALAFIGGNTALIVLGLAMMHSPRWRGYRLFSIALGVIGLSALVVFLVKAYGPLGVGGVERLVAFPLLVWGLVVGIHLIRLPSVARAHPTVPPGATT